MRLISVIMVSLLAAGIGSSGAFAQPSTSRVIVAQSSDIVTLDPQFKASLQDYMLMYHIFDTLVMLNERYEIVPHLAESWRTIGDKTWQFKLRRGVKFHNGEDFNALAVKFTLERMIDPTLKTRDPFWQEVDLERVEVVDEFTVNLVLKKPSAIVPSRLQYVYMLAPGYYRSLPLSEAARRPVGTGPYRFVEWVRDSHVTMQAFEGYWKGSPQVKEIVWRAVPDAATRVNELRAGRVDLISQLSPDQVPEVESSGPARVVWVEGARRMVVGIRCDRPPTDDRRVRQALNYAVNVDAILRFLLGGRGKRTITVVNAPNINPKLRAYEYNPQKARALLRAAGWVDSDGDGVLDKDGRPLSLTLDTPIGHIPLDREVAQIVAADLGKIGIRIKLQPLEWNFFLKRLFDKDMDDLYLYDHGSAFDFQSELRFLIKAHRLNGSRFSNPEYERLYSQLEETLDPDKRRALSFRLQEIAFEEAPWLFLFNEIEFYGLNKRINWNPRADGVILLNSATFR